ncbi:MAG TPA: hypothetical protein VEH62_04430 [Gemmatimonadales bacterium]|nr:hypothetical protein [Gemmatimonadales bacterium]
MKTAFREFGAAGLPVAAMAAALLLVAAAPVRAQQAGTDPHWQAWLGCWEPVSGPVRAAGDTSSAPLVCVIPAPGSVGVDVATLSAGRIVTRERIEAGGDRHDVTREGCSGWESAQFSSDGARVFLTAEYTCPGDLKRTTGELMAMTPEGEWLDVRGASARGLPEGVRVLRYRPARAAATVPSDLAWALQGSGMAVSTAREAAGAAPEVSDVEEASRALPPAIVEAWLVEEGQGFALDGRTLVQLRNDGVPGRVIDVMVALSYPRVFAIDVASHRGQRRPPEPVGFAQPPVYGLGYASPFGCYSPYSWDCYAPYGWGYYSPYYASPYGYWNPYGYWSGYGYYPSGGVIVVSGNGGQVARHGRMVIGRGYEGSGSGQTARPARSRAGSSGAPSGSERSSGRREASGGAPPPSSSSSPPPSSAPSQPAPSSSGSGGGERRAVPKP